MTTSTPFVRVLFTLACVYMLLLSGCSSGPEHRIEVSLFGPGVISTENPEFSTTFSVTGDTVLFSRASSDFSHLGTFRAIRSNGGWSRVDTLVYSDESFSLDPFFSNDGTRIYFSSNQAGGDGIGSWNTWIIQRIGNQWTRPIEAGNPPNTDSLEIFVSESSRGDLYFMSTYRGRGIYHSERLESGWAEPVALDIPQTQGRNVGNPLITPTGNTLVFTMDSASDSGDSNVDLFVTCRQDDGWSVPRRLPAPVNSPYMDFAPGIGPDGTLYFTSQRPGIVDHVPAGERRPGDLYRTTLDLAGLCM